jgi:hypothetical protein
MKKIICFLTVIAFFLLSFSVLAQEPVQETEDQEKMVMVIKNDGSRITGKILSRDAREILILTQAVGEVYIPMHEIREIREISERQLDSRGGLIEESVFATRYFITTNGLPIAKGDNYVILSLLGPDFQFGVSDNFGLGFITTWIGSPFIATAKYSFNLGQDANAAAGVLLGTDLWLGSGLRGALPYGAITLGNSLNNLNFSLGYGSISYEDNVYNPITGNSRKDRKREGRFLLSVAGTFKVGRTSSFVFDTFIVPGGKEVEREYWEYFYNPNTGYYDDYRKVIRKEKTKSFALIMPGVRIQSRNNVAFQFGFAGIRADGETIPVPMAQFFWML